MRKYVKQCLEKIYSLKVGPNFIGPSSFHFEIYSRNIWSTLLLSKSLLDWWAKYVTPFNSGFNKIDENSTLND